VAVPAQQPPAQQPEQQPEPQQQSQSRPQQTPAESAKQHFDRNEFDEAIAAYTEILRLNPGDAEAYYNRGDAYYGKGDIDRAAADWNEAIRLNPANASRPGRPPASGASEAAARARAEAEKADNAVKSNPAYNKAQDALDRLQGAWD
jgi:tetratricopeptide (TPR) repeat protein